MSHTNSTTNYALPQFITTDKPAWLTDINNAFLDIDNAINTAKTTADTAATDAGTAIGDAAAAQTTANTADAKGSGAIASLADTFDPTTIYAVGDYVMYNSLLYICSTAVITPGPWTGATNWDRITVEQIAANLKASGFYTIGDQISCRYMPMAGIVTNSQKTLQFFVPTAKPIRNSSSGSISGTNFRVYDDSTSQQVNITDGTWTFNIRDNGIAVTVDFATALSMSAAVVVYFSSSAYIELMA